MSLEESFPLEKMDKSTGRSTSVPPPKGANGSDNGTTNSKFASKNRRRAGPQSGSRPNNDYQASYRKTPIKYTDKRPRTRGYFNERQREEVTEDLRAEHTSVLRMGSKKTNLNHLLNFSVNHGESDRFSDTGGYKGNRSRKWMKKSTRYNKEQFLQANCQFVVKESGNYTVNSVDPDILVDWDLVEQVKIFGNQVPSCPICLYPPSAAKMTRCGHIYCWSCMLHYLSLSDKKTWRKCPICYEAVHQNDLKSVIALETRTYNIGDEIQMNLMKREKGTTYTVPVYQWTPRESKPHYVDDDVDLCFSKLLIAGVDQVQLILDKEKRELDLQMAEHKGTLEGSYVQAAMDLLKERQVNINLSKAEKESIGEKLEAICQQVPSKGPENTCGSTFAPLRKDIVEYASAFSDEETSLCEDMSSASLHPVQSAPNLQGALRTTSESSDDAHKSPRDNLSYTSEANLSTDSEAAVLSASPEHTGIMSVNTGDGEKVEVSVDEVADDLTLPGEDDGNKKGGLISDGKASGIKRSDAFFFYQASDGQHIYLHSINARCLVKEYGSLDMCPPVITAKIVELEGISMNEELRSRLRYLSHLPLTCEFKVAELALKPPVLSKETILAFSGEIEKRKRLRNRKKRDENRQLKKMQDTECRKYEQYPEMRALISSDYHVETKSTIVRSEMPSLLAVNSSGNFTGPGSSAAMGRSDPSPDFTPVGSPALSDVTVGSPPDQDDGGQAGMSFAQMLRAGKAKPTTTVETKPGADAAVAVAKTAAGSDSENEDRVPVPTYRESFGDAIVTALANYKKSDAPSEQPSSGGGGKKKKKQKKLLFVNTMARGK